MGKLFKSIINNWQYIIYASKTKIKKTLFNNDLGFLWMILEPICYMIMYSFLTYCVFDIQTPYMPAFILIGLTIWKFFYSTIISSSTLIKENLDIVSKVSVPKIILIAIQVITNLFNALISVITVLIFLLFYDINLTTYTLLALPIFIPLITITIGLSIIVMHLGVYTNNLKDKLIILFNFIFYSSGIFYSLNTMLPEPYNDYFINVNPIAYFIHEAREIILFNESTSILALLYWFIIGIIIIIYANKLVNKYENNYIKVLK